MGEETNSLVTYLDHMGDDLTVVNAARVSFNKQSEWHHFKDVSLPCHSFEIPYLNSKDKKLIKYLAKHNHWSPFSHPQISLRIKMPIFVARQWFKHQIGFARNEVSRRYVDYEPELYQTDVWRKKAENKKQGSSDESVDLDKHWALDGSLMEGKGVRLSIDKSMMICSEVLIRNYNSMIKAGVAPEQARMILPQNTYTEFVETASLYAYARLYNLRTGDDAQKETQEYAREVGKIIEQIYPYSWKVLTNEEETKEKEPNSKSTDESSV